MNDEAGPPDGFEWNTREELNVHPDLRHACVDRSGADPEAGMLPLNTGSVLDTTLCYRAMAAIKRVHPFLALATHDDDAGFRELEGPTSVLIALGHTVERNDCSSPTLAVESD